MNIQDKLERILRDMHILISRGPTLEEDSDLVVVHKKDMQKLLNGVSQAVSQMMEQYEVTEASKNRAAMEVEKHHMEIVRNANRQAEDIYAASVLYTDDALGRIQDIIDEAEHASRDIMKEMNRALEEEKRQVRSNQLELKSQLEDLKETAKYIKIIEERNREIAKAKAKKEGSKKPGKYHHSSEKDEEFVPITPDIKINEEYFEKAGLTPEGLPKDMMEEISEEMTEELPEEKMAYEKPVIKINEEYFEKAGIPLEKDEADEFKEKEKEEQQEHKKEKKQSRFPFGRR